MVGVFKCCEKGPHRVGYQKGQALRIPSDFENVHTLVESMESTLFDSVRYNTNHVLHQLLPPEKDIHDNMRQQSHALPSEDNSLIRKNFLHRMLFRDIYEVFVLCNRISFHHFNVFVVNFPSYVTL